MCNLNNTVYLYLLKKCDINMPDGILVPKYYGDDARDETRMGYFVLSYILKKYYDYILDIETIEVTDNGKPYIASGEYHFNISHSKDYVACAVSNCNVGVDIEQPRFIPRKLNSKILSKKEIGACGDNECLLKTWVIKEAYSKYIGKGVSLSFSSFSVDETLDNNFCRIIEEGDFICALYCTDDKAKIKTIYNL